MQHSELHVKNMYRCNKNCFKGTLSDHKNSFHTWNKHQRSLVLRTSQD